MIVLVAIVAWGYALIGIAVASLSMSDRDRPSVRFVKGVGMAVFWPLVVLCQLAYCVLLAAFVLALAGGVGAVSAAPPTPVVPPGVPGGMLAYPTPTPTPAGRLEVWQYPARPSGDRTSLEWAVVMDWGGGVDCVVQASRREIDPLGWCYERALQRMLAWTTRVAGVGMQADLVPPEIPKPLHHTPTGLAELVRDALRQGVEPQIDGAKVRLFGGRVWGQKKIVVAVKFATGRVFEIVFRDTQFVTNFWLDVEDGWNYAYKTAVLRDKLRIISAKQAAKLMR